MFKVSIIIPIYNNEKYIRRCLDSIVTQTLDELQVIMINDGSTDGTEMICKNYVEKYPNFEYYYKENGGSATARNVGLEHAKGEYVGFVDSDDYIEPTMYEKMYLAAKKNKDADIVFNTMIVEGKEDSYPFTLPKPGYYDRSAMEREIFPELLPHQTKTGTFRSFDWGNCSKLFKKNIIDNNHIRFYEKSRRCEDLCFAFECTIHAQSYFIMKEEKLYHYCVSENSKSRHYTKNMWYSISMLMDYLITLGKTYEEYDFTEKIQYCILYFCVIVIKNEVFGIKDRERYKRIKAIIDDNLCKDTIYLSTQKEFNKEYTAIFNAMRTGNAYRVDAIVRWYAWKKKYAAPVLVKLHRR